MIKNKTKFGEQIQNSKAASKHIKKFNPTPCYKCDGTGFAIGTGVKRKDAIKKLCEVCKGTGRWNEDTFDLIATTHEGHKIAFRVDGIK